MQLEMTSKRLNKRMIETTEDQKIKARAHGTRVSVPLPGPSSEVQGSKFLTSLPGDHVTRREMLFTVSMSMQ